MSWEVQWVEGYQGVAHSGLSTSHSVDNFSAENRYILFIKCKISRLSEIIENCQVRNIHTNKFTTCAG